MSTWTEAGSVEAGNQGSPGQQYHVYTAHLSRRGDRWRCDVDEDWGSNQGFLQSNGGNQTQGRGDSPEEAVEACRKDVFAWAGDNDQTRADLATMLRDLLYEVEDAAHDAEDN